MESALTIADLSSTTTFERVFRTYYQQLVAFAFQYMEDHDLAEEIVQDTFSNIWSQVDQINIRTSIKSYLYGAVRNAALNYLKHQRIERRYEQQEKNKDHSVLTDFLELDELQSRIDKALNQLPEKCREIFEMSRFEEKKYREIADELGVSIKTVETQMGRALKVMRTALEQYVIVLIFIGLYLWIKNLSG